MRAWWMLVVVSCGGDPLPRVDPQPDPVVTPDAARPVDAARVDAAKAPLPPDFTIETRAVDLRGGVADAVKAIRKPASEIEDMVLDVDGDVVETSDCRPCSPAGCVCFRTVTLRDHVDKKTTLSLTGIDNMATTFEPGKHCRAIVRATFYPPRRQLLGASPTTAPLTSDVQQQLAGGATSTTVTIVAAPSYVYRCPPCPDGAECKPCERDHIALDKGWSLDLPASIDVVQGSRYELTISIKPGTMQHAIQSLCRP